ncbi:MAG: hypothetical protein DPW18_06730 [Chloroflexi bacterium]|nr:hypothetical protein [Chloroflexota bacterium]MDL1942182.1 hypothetical protein [Chloroflexi bacterium CFX2]
MTLSFEGFIKDVQYRAYLAENLPEYDFNGFDINRVGTSGKIIMPNGEFAYSKWVSPKRTRSYPFERLYNTFNSPMRLTIIPVLKDEGLDGDLDRIQYSTVSWMNLLNVYIVLAYYDRAVKNTRPLQSSKNKITSQEFNIKIVNDQILRISQYKQSALHWNRTLIEDSFVDIYKNALDSYEKISRKTGVLMHDRNIQEQYLATIMRDFLKFKDISLRGSRGASVRETQTLHSFEYLADGVKATFKIENYLGGTYYLTADEVVQEGDIYVIQESKNSTRGFLPSLSDVKDGLFKLILYSNLHTLKLNFAPVRFRSRLKLTGRKVRGALSMPCSEGELSSFFILNKNACTAREIAIIRKMNQEAAHNQKLEILISSNEKEHD